MRGALEAANLKPGTWLMPWKADIPAPGVSALKADWNSPKSSASPAPENCCRPELVRSWHSLSVVPSKSVSAAETPPFIATLTTSELPTVHYGRTSSLVERDHCSNVPGRSARLRILARSSKPAGPTENLIANSDRVVQKVGQVFVEPTDIEPFAVEGARR